MVSCTSTVKKASRDSYINSDLLNGNVIKMEVNVLKDVFTRVQIHSLESKRDF